eukprot:scaffold4405_cov31-Tisochrysis_lutea.AAC.6
MPVLSRHNPRQYYAGCFVLWATAGERACTCRGVHCAPRAAKGCSGESRPVGQARGFPPARWMTRPRLAHGTLSHRTPSPHSAPNPPVRGPAAARRLSSSQERPSHAI